MQARPRYSQDYFEDKLRTTLAYAATLLVILVYTGVHVIGGLAFKAAQ